MWNVPSPVNEPVRSYAPGTPERTELEAALKLTAGEVADIPVVTGGKRIKTSHTSSVVMPHAHGHKLATLHHAAAEHVAHAIDQALKVAPAWQATPFEARASIFLKAAELLTGPWRARINAACMLGQSKTCHQSEIDAACELIDFFRFNVAFAATIAAQQPISPPGAYNRVEYRALEGFVLAIAPFNFLSIAVNLATAPALMGNVVLWKPSNQAALGAYRALELLEEAGLPEGVISFLPGDGPTQGSAAIDSEHLAGIHFTGSTTTFRALNKEVAARLERYRCFPRLVGETGGKDFIVAHPSADVPSLVTAILRGGYEYQGQKCSAASRVYVPRSLWNDVRDRVVAELKTMTVGDVSDFKNFMGAVIDERAFDKINKYLELARSGATVLHGGKGDKRSGYFVEPTFVEVHDAAHRLMQEEVFGPVVAAWVYEDDRWLETLEVVDRTSPYALTGAVFAQDRGAVGQAERFLRHSAGNFYINDKPTGAVVGQQPFGGMRASGTNDKAGSIWNLVRWTSPRLIKETFVPPHAYRYPFQG